jgi:hypothetical protein
MHFSISTYFSFFSMTFFSRADFAVNLLLHLRKRVRPMDKQVAIVGPWKMQRSSSLARLAIVGDLQIEVHVGKGEKTQSALPIP